MIVSRWNNQTCERKGESLSSSLIRGLIPLLSSLMFSYRSFLGWKEQQSSFFNLPFFFIPHPWKASYVICLLRYIPLFHWSWPSICWSCRLLLECLSHLPPYSTCCELQQPRWYCSGVIFSLMRPDRQLWAFNAEVTASPGIAPPPCSHGWSTMLALFAWDARGGCL